MENKEVIKLLKDILDALAQLQSKIVEAIELLKQEEELQEEEAIRLVRGGEFEELKKAPVSTKGGHELYKVDFSQNHYI